MRKIPSKSFLQRQFPTLIGLTVLILALVLGVVFLGAGPGVFVPRATPETTPKQVRVTNLSNNSFTVTFATDTPVAGFLKYGQSAGKLDAQSSDDRDKLSGSIGEYLLHHITVQGLQPNTTYFYQLGTGDGNTFDDNGQPFSITTAPAGGSPSAARTSFGTLLDETGQPAEGAIVYISGPDMQELSQLVKSSGTWAVPLSNARGSDGSFANLGDSDAVTIQFVGSRPGQNIAINVPVSDTQPVETISFGQTGASGARGSGAGGSGAGAPSDGPTADDQLAGDGDQTVSVSPPDFPSTSSDTSLGDLEVDTANSEGTAGQDSQQGDSLADLLEEGITGTSQPASASTASATVSDADRTVDLQSTEAQTVLSTQPIIKGNAAANVPVTVTINSSHTIEQQVSSDSSGNFSLDLAALGAELEPGQHSATYSYIDPETSEEITQTVFFTVDESATSSQLAQADTSSSTSTSTSPSPSPFSSGDPFTLDDGSGTGTGSATATGSAGTADGSRSALPATDSAVPVSGAVGATLALVGGGLFFIVAGGWSYWLATQLERRE
ncbi:MAG: hypothetical protein COU69_03370 [Candidatus Pacebacteria bacterium CG10_big_fil_rev_8_21_14_0_10_56_10]|nr:MAG: hypothetical protein COU69_03370 [Candidatus Pacebacteria bacterium CG10_big_fil_rev_8_21_14_0_10_56_10]